MFSTEYQSRIPPKVSRLPQLYIRKLQYFGKYRRRYRGGGIQNDSHVLQRQFDGQTEVNLWWQPAR